YGPAQHHELFDIIRNGSDSDGSFLMAFRQALRWASAQTFVRMALGFASAKITAIYVGPAGMVLVGQLGNLITVASGAIGNSAGSGVVTLPAERPGETDRLFRLWATAFRLALALSAILALFLIAAAKPLSAWLLFSGAPWSVVIAAAVAVVFAVVDNIVTS